MNARVRGSILTRRLHPSAQYSIKDSLRALGFRWDADRRCWGSDLESVTAVLGTDDITVDALVEAGVSVLSDDSKAARPIPKSRGQYGGAYAVVEDDVVSVFNSYDIKDGLRDRSFRCDLPKPYRWSLLWQLCLDVRSRFDFFTLVLAGGMRSKGRGAAL